MPVEISPELVLVSPELGEAARLMLGGPGQVYCGTYDGSSHRAQTPPSDPELRAAEPGHRGANGLRSLAVVAAIAGVLVGFPGLNGASSSSGPAPTAQRLSWPAAPGSSYYDLQLFRDGAKVFEAWPPSPSARVPATWTHNGRGYRLAAGTYQWYVWPGRGSRAAARYGPVLRHGSLVVAG